MRTSEIGSKNVVDAELPTGGVETSKTTAGAAGARTTRIGAVVAALLLAGGAAWWRHGLEEPPAVQASMSAPPASAEAAASAQLIARQERLDQEQREMKERLRIIDQTAEEQREKERRLDAQRHEVEVKRREYEKKLDKLHEESKRPTPRSTQVASVRSTPAPTSAVSPNAFAPASATMHTAIVQAITRANAAEMRAFRTLEAGPLARTHSGKALEALQMEITALRAKNEFRAGGLASTDVQSVQVSGDQRTARVRTTEVWEQSWYDRNSSVCLRHVHQRPVPQTALLRWTNGAWLIDSVAFDAAPPPQVVRCHYQ